MIATTLHYDVLEIRMENPPLNVMSRGLRIDLRLHGGHRIPPRLPGAGEHGGGGGARRPRRAGAREARRLNDIGVLTNIAPAWKSEAAASRDAAEAFFKGASE